MKREGACGFTADAVIVVTVALAMTAATFVPFLAQSQSGDREKLCQARLKQLWIATSQYAQDYDERFPPSHHPKTEYYWWGKLRQDKSADLEGSSLFPYVKNTDIFRCPSFNIRVRKDAEGVGFGYNYRYVGGSYGVTGDDAENEKNALAATEAEIKEPIRTVMFADSARWNYFAEGKQPFLEENPYLEPPSRKNPTFHARHLGNGNVVYVDGHADVVEPRGGDRSEKVKDAPKELGHLPELLFDRG